MKTWHIVFGVVFLIILFFGVFVAPRYIDNRQIERGIQKERDQDSWGDNFSDILDERVYKTQ